MDRVEKISLADAAMRLGISWHRAWRLALTGDLEARREGGRWYVSVASIEKYAARAGGGATHG